MWKTILRRSTSPIHEPNLLVVGTNAEFPPFTFIINNEIVGFDIDIINEVARRIGKHVFIKDMPFESLIIECMKGYVQVIAAGLTATPERAEKMLFTTPYIHDDPLRIMSLAKHEPINSVSDLVGKTVIVNDGFNADTYMSARHDVEIIRLPTVLDAVTALRLGRADAYVTSMNAVQKFLEKNSADEYRFTNIEGTEENCSLAVCKQSTELYKKIESTIQSMLQDGTIDKLKKKWKMI